MEIDGLALFVPLSTMTKDFVNKENLDLFKNDIKIVNVGR
jgi:lactate dehydrogenase-like 2-hydroxyacid dehydrogenase